MLQTWNISLAVSWLDRLFGLDSDRLSFWNDQTRLTFQHALPGWVWLLIILGALGLASWSYSGMSSLGSRRARWALVLFRAMLIVFVAALLAGPMLVLPRELVEPDWLLVLVDRSASLSTRDMVDSEGGGAAVEPITRDQALREALESHAEVFGAKGLGKDRRVVWLGFDEGVYDLAPPVGAEAVDWSAPTGHTTALRTAINQALRRAAGQPVSGIVLFTDGRSPQPTGGDWARRLNQQAVSVFPVPLGSSSPPLDLAIGSVQAPSRAFVNDFVPVTVWLEQYPAGEAAAGLDPSRIRVKLVDVATGKTLDEQPPGPSGLDEPVRLSVESKRVGPANWRVEVRYESDGPEGREVNLENNKALVSVEMVDRPIRVLYVEGYPRWDYRYLKSMLIREKSITSSVMLRSADRQFIQEGDQPLARLPRTAEEFKPFDVIIIGDVPRNYWSPQQLSVIHDHVAYRGAGVLWIGGAYFNPRTYDAPPMAELLPMRLPGEVSRSDPGLGAVALRPTPLARMLHVMRLTAPQPGRAVLSGEHVDPYWPGILAPLRWSQDLGVLKPSAEVLAVGVRGSSEALPLVTRLRFGAGQSIYVATDDTWRWRHSHGAVYFERFWIQLIRMLARDRLSGDSQRAALRVSHRRVERGQAVVVELRLTDAMVASEKRDSIRVSVRSAQGQAEGGDAPLQTLELGRVRESAGGGSSVEGGFHQSGVYRAIWRPMTVGRLRLSVEDPALADLGVDATIEVIDPNDEMRQPLPDHARLRELAKQTSGRVVPLDKLDQLVARVPNRARRIDDDISERLWDSPMSLLMVLMLLTLEWVGRKLIRLM